MFLLKKNIGYFFRRYCAIKFLYVVVPSIVIETVFPSYFENNFSYWLSTWQHHFSQPENANSKILASGHYLSNVFIAVIKIIKILRENSRILQNSSMHQNGVTWRHWLIIYHFHDNVSWKKKFIPHDTLWKFDQKIIFWKSY